MLSFNRSSNTSCLSDEDLDVRVEELRKEWEGGRSIATIRLMMADIRPNYRAWLRTKSTSEIFKSLPCLQEGQLVS